MPYKYQGFGAGPTTPRVRMEIYGAVLAAVVIYVLVAIVLLKVVPAHAATFKCKGFTFIYAELECEQPTPPATAGALFCQIYSPVRWSPSDTRGTKEQVDSLNRVWKRLCAQTKAGSK